MKKQFITAIAMGMLAISGSALAANGSLSQQAGVRYNPLNYDLKPEDTFTVNSGFLNVMIIVNPGRSGIKVTGCSNFSTAPAGSYNMCLPISTGTGTVTIQSLQDDPSYKNTTGIVQIQ